MDESEILKVGFDPLRVCEAISRIGYESHSAIMDLVDNSVAADATDVRISLYLVKGRSLKSRNSVSKYQIVDDGRGMDEAGILNAFSLGADRKYPEKSLSKYGMGLKSAGLSLGSRIYITSKKNGSISSRYCFDIRLVEEHGLAVSKRALTPDELAQFEKLISGASGTMIEIEGCEDVNHSSPKSTIDKLRQRLGVVYYSFLARVAKPLRIWTRVCAFGEDSNFEAVHAKDMLFLDAAKANTGWTGDTYDYASPYLVLDKHWDSLKARNGNALPPIRIQAVAFPQAWLATERSPLSIDDKARITSYAVSRENSGFFIYRNGRLIRWGDGLEGADGKDIITKDEINLRVRLEIDDTHDDVLHVDVSKQRLEIDDEIRGEIALIVARAKKTASEIRVACAALQKAPDQEEGRGFSLSARNVPEDDPQEAAKGEPAPEVADRKRAKSEQAAQVMEVLESEDESTAQQEGDVSGKIPTPIENEFRKVRYSEKIAHGQVWKPFYDAKEGVFVCINRNHPFYEQFLSRYPEGSVERLSLEALIFSVALAESNVFDNEIHIGQEALDRLFRRFHQNIDRWLADWVFENTDIE